MFKILQKIASKVGSRKTLVFIAALVLGIESNSQAQNDVLSPSNSEREYLAMLCFGDHLASTMSKIPFEVFKSFCFNSEKLLIIDTLKNNIENLEVYKISFSEIDSFKSLFSSDTLLFTESFLFNQASLSSNSFSNPNKEIAKVVFKYYGYYLPISGFGYSHLPAFFEFLSLDQSENKKGDFYPLEFVCGKRFSRQASLKKLIRKKHIDGIDLRFLYKRYRKTLN